MCWKYYECQKFHEAVGFYTSETTSFLLHVHKPSHVLIVHLLLIGELRNFFSTSLWKLWNIIKTSVDLNDLFQCWKRAEWEGGEGAWKRGWESGGHTVALSELGLCCPPRLYINIYMWNRGISSLEPVWTFGSLRSARVQISRWGEGYTGKAGAAAACLDTPTNTTSLFQPVLFARLIPHVWRDGWS